jgi:hypothetical protein
MIISINGGKTSGTIQKPLVIKKKERKKENSQQIRNYSGG